MRTCAFCPSSNVTNEHLWGKWFSKRIPGRPGNFTMRHSSVPHEWNDSEISFKAGVACRACNNGWMNDLEVQFSKHFSDMIFHGTPISLLSRGLSLIAAYMFKCAIVGDHMKSKGKPFFLQVDRYRFKETLEIPDGVQMWIAAFTGKMAYSGRWVPYYFRPMVSPLSDFEFYAFTYLAGKLALQLLVPRCTGIHQFGRPLPRLAPDKVWEETAIRFWPPNGLPITWPLPIYLDDRSFNEFRDRWRVPIIYESGQFQSS